MKRVRKPLKLAGLWLPTFVLAASLALPSLADGTGILISGDNDQNINVTIDPSLISDLQIKRSDGKMVIRMPEMLSTEASKLDIQPSLKSNSAVQVSESGKGRTITVNSERVYLSIQELGSIRYKDPVPTEKADKVTKLDKTDKNADKAVAAVATAAPTPAKPAKAPEPKAAPTPAIAQAPEPGAITSVPSSPNPAPEPAAITKALPNNTQNQPPESTEALSPFSYAEDTDIAAGPMLPDAESGVVFPSMADQQPDFLNEGENGIPLDLLSERREANRVTSTNTMLRLLLGLLLVLGMAIGFIKLALPRLMQKYPAFFERLKARAESKAQEAPAPASVTASPSSEETQKKEAGTMPVLPFAELFSKDRASKPYASEPDSKKNYLEKISLPSLLPQAKASSETFDVISSQSLGKGKELHLVSIKGRQLVVATTPYSVNLIADVTDQQDFETNYTQADAEQEVPSPENKPSTRAFIENKTTPHFPQAELKSDSPVKPSHRNSNIYKKYVSEPAQPTAQSNKAPETDTPERAKVREEQRQLLKDMAAKRLAERQAAQETAHQAQHEELPYVDAEEVVVLHDYDDIYEA